MKLVPASLTPPDGLEAFLLELGLGENGFGGTDYAPDRESLADYLQRLLDTAAGINLRPEWVPGTTFWLLDDSGEVVGMSRLRHRLNDQLLHHGGHIGYYVGPSARGSGYGSQILALTLQEGCRMGIQRFLLTVFEDNEPSIRVIEGNGGVMEDRRIDHETGEPFLRYWIGPPDGAISSLTP